MEGSSINAIFLILPLLINIIIISICTWHISDHHYQYLHLARCKLVDLPLWHSSEKKHLVKKLKQKPVPGYILTNIFAALYVSDYVPF